jgi:hypothetical protein
MQQLWPLTRELKNNSVKGSQDFLVLGVPLTIATVNMLYNMIGH